MVRDAITRVADAAVEIVEISSEGDCDMRPLRDFSARGVFAGALEEALRRGDIDIAVHSYKDLPLDPVGDLTICAVLPREDARDALCGMTVTSLHHLPQGARIATGSARRASILRTLRADLVPVDIRGNVATRLTRSAERGDDACMLACAGLRRLGRADSIVEAFDVSIVVPDAAQGIVAVQARAADIPMLNIWESVSCSDTMWAADVERAVARAAGGGCAHPVGVHVHYNTSLQRWSCHVFRALVAGAPGTTHSTFVDRASTSAAAAAMVVAQLPMVEAV